MWLLSYDVTSDNRRAKLAARLERRGMRLLYSTFALTGDAQAAQQAYAVAEHLVTPTDRLLLLRTCPRCEIHRTGQTAAPASSNW